MGKKKSKTQKQRKNEKKKQLFIEKKQNNVEKNIVKEISKENKKEKRILPSYFKRDLKKSNLFINRLKNCYKILFKKKYIFLNVFVLLTYFFLLLGLITVEVYSLKVIFFIGGLLLFLLLIAISYTKYLSGKIFTVILVLIMSFSIYKLQYNYDFIRGLNTQKYEKKTFYIVTFDTNINRNVYVLNNKKIGLLEENSLNIERKLNTKLDNIHYLTYKNMNDLTSSFYNQEFRGIIVNENQYKYLQNSNYSRSIKILYEFYVNGAKEKNI